MCIFLQLYQTLPFTGNTVMKVAHLLVYSSFFVSAWEWNIEICKNYQSLWQQKWTLKKLKTWLIINFPLAKNTWLGARRYMVMGAPWRQTKLHKFCTWATQQLQYTELFTNGCFAQLSMEWSGMRSTDKALYMWKRVNCIIYFLVFRKKTYIIGESVLKCVVYFQGKCRHDHWMIETRFLK